MVVGDMVPPHPRFCAQRSVFTIRLRPNDILWCCAASVLSWVYIGLSVDIEMGTTCNMCVCVWWVCV